jgi:hypothetical protein
LGLHCGVPPNQGDLLHRFRGCSTRGFSWSVWDRAPRIDFSLSGLRSGLPKLVESPLSLRSSPQSLVLGPPLVRQGLLFREHPLAVLDEQGQRQGQDDDQEHQSADA